MLPTSTSNNAFDTVFHSNLIGKLRNCGLDEWSVRCIENWLNSRAQRVVIWGTESIWRPVNNGQDWAQSYSTSQ